MRAITVQPGVLGSVKLATVEEPQPEAGQALLETLEVGVCGTDREIVAGGHGAAPAGVAWLIPGHECLARILAAPAESGLRAGQLVAPTVRRPCGRPRCYPCAHDHPDMCVTLQYTERGIQGAHGYQCERFVEWPRYLVPLPGGFAPFGVLMEPTSVVTKAIEEAARVQRARLAWEPHRALVTGAGPVGLLAAMLLRLRHLDVTVYDRDAADHPRAQAVRALGATYVCSADADLQRTAGSGGVDWIVECTGARALVFGCLQALAPAGVLCLLGVSGAGGSLEVPADAINLGLVLRNGLVFGSVNASREAFAQAGQSLAVAEATWPGWLSGLVTRRLAPAEVSSAVGGGAEGIKTAIRWAS